MALNIDTNKDIEEFKETVLAGQDLRNSIWMIVSLLVGGMVSLILYFKYNVQITLAVYAAIPFTATIYILGTYKKDGMTLLQSIRHKLRKSDNVNIVYSSTENEEEYKKHNVQSVAVTKEDNDAYFMKLVKIAISVAIIAVVLVIVVIVLLVKFVHH